MVSKSNIYTVEELVKSGVLYKPLDGNHGGIHPKGSDFVESGIPFIMASDMLNGQIDTRNCKFISSEQASTLRKGFAITGDVLLSHKATIGRTAIVGDIDSDFIVLTPQVTYYRIKDSKKLDNRYLKYYFDSHQFQSILNQWAGGGSTRAYLGITAQLKLPINVIDISDQKTIAHILSTLDNKIEINRQMNETLEAMAQALFKSWFVDFDPVIDNVLLAGKAIPEPFKKWAEIRQAQLDSGKAKINLEVNDLFPSEFEFTEELGWIPMGWEVKNISKLAEKISKGTTPRKAELEKADDEAIIPFIKVKDIDDSGFIDTKGLDLIPRSIHESSIKRSILKEGDVLFSIAGTIGRTSIIPKTLDDSNANQAVAFIRPNSLKYSNFIHQALKSERVQHRALSRVVQAVQANFSLTELGGIPLVDPSNKVFEYWYKNTDSIYRKISDLQESSDVLANLRDTLLPKLMSGELRISDAEKLAENI